MTDKELIKEEIERIIEEETPISKGSDYYHGAKESMEKLLQFIDFLPEEPASQDFESEWKRYIDSKGGGAVTINIKDVAHHFAKWKEEQFLEFLLWLDDNYVIKSFTDGEPITYTELIDNFKSNSYKRNEKFTK